MQPVKFTMGKLAYRSLIAAKPTPSLGITYPRKELSLLLNM
jgi:hypothetical protein